MSILIQFHSRLVRGEDSQANAALIIYVSVTINCISPSTKSKPLFSPSHKNAYAHKHTLRFQISSQTDAAFQKAIGQEETGSKDI